MSYDEEDEEEDTYIKQKKFKTKSFFENKVVLSYWFYVSFFFFSHREHKNMFLTFYLKIKTKTKKLNVTNVFSADKMLVDKMLAQEQMKSK